MMWKSTTRRVVFLGIALALFYVLLIGFVRDANAMLRVGVQDDGLAISNPELALTRASNLCARQFRILIRLDSQNLADYDKIMATTHAAGLTNFVTLTGYHDKRVIAEAARRWPYVQYWSFWNEPELSGPSAHSLRYIYHYGIREVHRINPYARILEGEVAPYKQSIAYVKALGPLKGIYGLAIHPYWFQTNNAPAPAAMNHLSVWTRLLARPAWRKLHHNLLVTEYGEWGPMHPNVDFSFTRNQSVGRAASQLRYTFRYLHKAHVREFIYYHVSASPSVGWDTGLFNLDGTRRPIWWVIKHETRKACLP